MDWIGKYTIPMDGIRYGKSTIFEGIYHENEGFSLSFDGVRFVGFVVSLYVVYMYVGSCQNTGSEWIMKVNF